jgi:hypothetical protein
MGQQEIEARGVLRRMLLVLAVAAVMATMVAVSASPAFAVSERTPRTAVEKACISSDGNAFHRSGICRR